MGHNLSVVNGNAEMMYVGKRPWHGLGTELQNPATAEEAIRAAHMDWTVSQQPVFVAGKEVEEYRANVRDDNAAVLAIVGQRYTPVQNAEAFGFFDAVVGAGQAVYHTAGALGKGERIWILAKLPGEIRVDASEDKVEKFTLLTSTHDGSSCLRMFYTPVRVVCQNTLNMALQGRSEGIALRHTQGIHRRVDEAQRALGLATKFYDDLEGLVNRLASVTVSRDVVREYVRRLVPDNKDAKFKTRAENIRAAMERNFTEGRGNNLRGVAGTWWAAYNGVTEYADHDRTTRGKSEAERASNRLESIWFGSAASLKQRAWNVALEMAEIKAN